MPNNPEEQNQDTDDRFEGEVEYKPRVRKDNEILGAFFKDGTDEEPTEDETEDTEEPEQEETEEEGATEDEEEPEEAGEEEEVEGEEEEETDEGRAEENKDKRKEDEKDALGDDGKPLNKKELLGQKVKIKVFDDVEEITVREAIKRAQKAEAAERRFQEAADQRKQAFDIVEVAKTDPLKAAYLLNAHEKGDEYAYQFVKKVCQDFLGKEMEFLSLPPEEQAKRQHEAAMARKEAEIERLRQEKDADSRKLRGQLLARQIVNEVGAAGLEKNQDTYLMVARIFDAHEARGQIVPVKQCVQELIHLLDTHSRQRISTLSEEELAKLRSKKGDRRERPGRAMRVRKRPASTKPAKKREKQKPPPQGQKYYSSYREAWEADQEEQRALRRR